MALKNKCNYLPSPNLLYKYVGIFSSSVCLKVGNYPFIVTFNFFLIFNVFKKDPQNCVPGVRTDINFVALELRVTIIANITEEIAQKSYRNGKSLIYNTGHDLCKAKLSKLTKRHNKSYFSQVSCATDQP